MLLHVKTLLSDRILRLIRDLTNYLYLWTPK